MKHYIWLIAATLMLNACIKDDTKFGDLVPADTGEDPVPIVPVSIEFDYTALSGETEDIPSDPTDETYNDYVEHDTFNRTITITYDGESATVTGRYSGATVTTDGAHVTVNNTLSRIHLVVTGSSDNGSLKVYSDHKYKLSLNGVTLTNPTGPAINNQCGKTLYLVLPEDTDNTLQDGATYTDIPDDEQAKAALFSEGQIIFSGNGTLTVTAVGRGGVYSDDYIRVRPGVMLNVTSTAAHAIKSNDGLWIDGGVINASTSAAGSKAIRSENVLNVSGGRLVAITTAGSVIDTTTGIADTTSCAAIKCDSLMTVSAGTLRLKSTGEGGKGLNAASDLTITGGSIEVVTTGEKGLSTPKGIKVDGTLTMSAGYLYSYSAVATPLEAMDLQLSTSYITYERKPRRVIIQY